VQKYGGTSVGSLNRIEAVADNIIKTRQQGHQVVAVLSAMSGETNRLLAMAHTLDQQPSSRELDMLLATGEQTTIALLAIALIQRGYSAVSLLAHQVGIFTDNHFGRARIQTIATERLAQSLEQEQIVLVAGFQGVDAESNITTLGRGGSDTTAIAVAVALAASECQIFTDVDGIYTADPRIEPYARKLEQISFEEMLVMANLGAKVLHNRAVEYAMMHKLPIRVLSSFTEGNGTKVVNLTDAELPGNNQGVVSIVSQQKELLFSLPNIKSEADIATIFQRFAEEGIDVDMVKKIRRNSDEFLLNFTLHKDDQAKALSLLQLITNSCNLGAISCDENVAKLSVVAISLKSDNEILVVILATLAQKNIKVALISSSEIHISVIINQVDLVSGVHALHNAFNLKLLS
jgi:aspartate kinase